MDEIETVEDIGKLAMAGFDNWESLGHVSVKERGSLRLFNYGVKAVVEGRWNFFEKVSRGLIIDALTGEVVARPFDKFFNWGEGDRYAPSPVDRVTEKMDGSLGILYREQGIHRIATRGSFDSDQALWATGFLKRYNLDMYPDLTFLFEIIYPGNRIVVDYRGREDLVLLAIRNRKSGDYLPWHEVRRIANYWGFGLPHVYDFKTPDDIVKATQSIDANSEGWVVEFRDGQRFKFKGEEYKKLHKLISGLSFKNTLACVASNSLDDLRAIVPDEFLAEVDEWVVGIQQTVERIKQDVEAAYQAAPKGERKEFALWVMENHKDLSPYLFAKLDKRALEPLIYKLAF